MSYSKIILHDSADIVWPLDDINQSSSISKPINFYNSSEYSFSASISTDFTDVSYTPIIFGGGTALRFTSSSIGMSIPAMNLFSELYSNKSSCMSLWFQTEYLSEEETVIFKKRNHENIGLFIKNNYLIFRYGTSASYSEVYGDIPNPMEPTHIIVGKTPSSISMIINGVLFSNRESQGFTLEPDANHLDNDFIDFYGPPENNWVIDSVSFFPNVLTEIDAKRHYIYGLGKYVGDDIFHSFGGTIYNFSTIDTEKIFNLSWRYPKEWKLTNINDLVVDNSGIGPMYFDEPEFYSYNSDILTNNDQISFRNSSGSTVVASYIDISKLYRKIGSGEYPFFIKLKLDGNLPKEYEKQRIFSYGAKPDNEILQFNLYNQSGSYKLLVESIDNLSTSFDIDNAQDQPDIYIGMKFLNQSYFYFCQSGSPVQTASFNYYDVNQYGLDPMKNYFPPDSTTMFRIGSSISYDRDSYPDSLPSVNQFSGTFKNISVAQKEFYPEEYSDIDLYRKSRYKLSFDTNKNRFKIYSYGSADFNLHAIDIGYFNNDTDQTLSANIINFGYPDINSSSQVMFYVTHYDYSGSVIYPKTRFYQNDTLPFINNNNISGTYLKFDLEIYSEDSNYFPPKVKGFNFETYSGDPDKVTIRNDDGESYKLYNSSSYVYLPEIRRTPNIFMTKDSGIKMKNSISEFTDNFVGKPLDPRTIDGLVQWLDARFVNGLNSINQEDDSYVIKWTDLSGNDNHAIQSDSASAPVFRIQSLNLLTNNQGNGGEDGGIQNILGINCSASPSPDGAVSGIRAIKVSPDNSSSDSYVELGRNTASFTIYPSQEYSLLGSIKLLKPQTASYLHYNARSIHLYIDSGSGLTFTASSNTASNSAGVYNLYTQFTSPSVVLDSSIRLYNGSYSEFDTVYWDNIALYPKQSGSYIDSWIQPLTSDNDMPTIKFNGLSHLINSASAGPLVSLYTVSRSFEEGSDNLFKVNLTSGSIVISSGSYIGLNSMQDCSAVVIYNGIHDSNTSSIIENWLRESFNIY